MNTNEINKKPSKNDDQLKRKKEDNQKESQKTTNDTENQSKEKTSSSQSKGISANKRTNRKTLSTEEPRRLINNYKRFRPMDYGHDEFLYNRNHMSMSNHRYYDPLGQYGDIPYPEDTNPFVRYGGGGAGAGGSGGAGGGAGGYPPPDNVHIPRYNPMSGMHPHYDYGYDMMRSNNYHTNEFEGNNFTGLWRRNKWRGGWNPKYRQNKPPTFGSNRSRAEGNDYNQHFVDTAQRPQNFLRDSLLEDQYEDYPNAKRLVALKDYVIKSHAIPPYYLKADLSELELTPKTFGTKFDVVLIDPPWEEYVRRAPGVGDGTFWKWQDIQNLKIDELMDSPSFVFLWCGSEEGLEAGRHCLNRWGYRRCEDIVWIKTNKNHERKAFTATNQDARSVLQHTKEHCLMGIKGTVRRATDGHVIHANIDTDVIVSEEPPLGSTEKPEQLYQIIERFCMGKRRIELFGEDHNIRPGWVVVGTKLTGSNFKKSVYASHFKNQDGSILVSTVGRPQPGQPNLLPSTDEIEMLRPKSPQHPS